MRVSRVKTAMILVVVFGLCLSISQAEDDYRDSMIGSISVLIDNEPGGEDIEKLIAIKPGDVFSLKKINTSIKQVYQTGLFSHVQVLSEGAERLNLTFLLVAQPFSRRIQILSEEKIPRAKLTEQIYSVKEGSPYSEDKLRKSVEELKAALRREGYFDAEIKAYTERVQDTAQVDVIFQVQSTHSYRVESITFEGTIILPEKRLLNRMKTKVGRSYMPALLENDLEAIQQLYLDQDYRRAEVRNIRQDFDEQRGSVALILEVIPREKIVIHVSGTHVPLNLIRPIWEAEIFEEWGLDEGEAKIIAYLRKKGYLFVSVSSSIEEVSSEIHIIHKIAPGQKLKIGDITYRGLEYFTPEQLKRELLTLENIPLLSRIDGAKLFELPVELEFLYKTRGFPDTRVEFWFEREGNTVLPIYHIEEGRQQTLNDVEFEGASLFPADVLQAQVSSAEGGPYYQPNVQQDIERLQNYYLNEGVRNTSIQAVVEEKEEDRFDVGFLIEEGKKVQIQEIVITGNDVTRTSTIRNELRIAAGELARYDAIRETKRRLEGLGIFSEVKIEEIQTSPESMNLFIIVAEGSRTHVSAGLGLETANEPHSFDVWNYDVRVRGTAELTRGNIFGTAAQFSLVGQLSVRAKRLMAAWQQPYFFKLPLETFVNAWWEEEQRTSFRYARQGISLSGARTFKNQANWTVVPALKYVRTKILELDIGDEEIGRQFLPYSTTSLGASLLRDRRSNLFNPERGYFFSTALDWAYPLFGAESDFLKSFWRYQHFLPLWTDMMISFTSRLGLGAGRMPIPERFFAGGSNSFRGTRYDELGPKDPVTGNPIGGKALLLFNFEFSFPLTSRIPNLYGVVFYDKGNVFIDIEKMNLTELEDALGLGLRYRSPLGPVRLELAWNPGAEEGKPKALVFITIGHIF
ncbi:MAG: BamA/TamA family outer membrane protein [Candidatus Aminicenantes bacterium]|nr:BamA/TamA family outer membrane protein [Candidatus Aminicenantes bacterium]